MGRPIELFPEHVQLMRELNRYRLLDQSMMSRVGTVGRDRQRVGELARLLVRKNLAARTEAPLVAGVRRLPHLYWLTHTGAATLNDLDGLEGDDKALGADRRFGDRHEVMHRVGIVEMHVAARAWSPAAGVELGKFTSDFEPGSRGRQKATTITDKTANGREWRFTPDATLWAQPPGANAPQLLVLELERGGERGDLSPFFREKLPHLKTLAAGEYVERSFDPPLRGWVRFLIVFGSHVVRKGKKVPLHEVALDKWPDRANPVWDRFYITSQDAVKADFGGDWYQPGTRQRRDLFVSARKAVDGD